MAYDEKTVGRVRKLLSIRPDVVEKKIMGGLCFMVKDRMCCSVSGKGGLLIRVGSDAHQLMLAEPHVEPMEMRGRVMTGFVRVAPEGYRTDAELKKWVKRGVEFVVTMPSAPSSRKGARHKVRKQR
ncbi:MAG TPA: TfoX/Sxy family protein [Bradyrhizobium sp.]|nr:TfoX/Sxy family protein [Bradyrhizobium sp.]